MSGKGFKKQPEMERRPGKETGRGPKTKEKVDPRARRAQQYTRDILRAGRPSDIVDMLEDEEEVESVIEATDLSLNEEEQFDSEIETTDDDALDQGEWLDDFLPSKPEFPPEPWQADLANTVAITVHQGVAAFRVPDWAARYDDKDLEDRWTTFRALAEWLNRERGGFLREPNYLNLGKDAFDFDRPVPVLYEGLYQILELPVHKATFSKHCNHGVILWEARMMKLDELWGQQAKLGWFAQAVIKRQRERGYLDRNSLLGASTIQPPRNKTDKDAFVKRAKSQADRLGPEEYVALLCCLTGCKWQHVLDRHASEIFYNEDAP